MRRDRLIRNALRERFVVTLKSGETFDGLLVEADVKTFVLANAWSLEGRDRVSVDGQLFVPRDEVSYLQRIGSNA